MRALILAAGLGTRLDPLTRYLPKCLMPLRGKPLLELWFEKLDALGITEFVVNTHYLAHAVEEHISAGRFADRVTLSHEPVLLGTAETIRKHSKFLVHGDNIILHADNFCEDDLVSLLEAHAKRPSECVMTMLTFVSNEPSTCGIVESDSRGVMSKIHHKVADPPNNIANAATYVVTPELIEITRASQSAFDFSAEILPQLRGRVMTHHTLSKFLDIGTIPNYLAAATDNAKLR